MPSNYIDRFNSPDGSSFYLQDSFAERKLTDTVLFTGDANDVKYNSVLQCNSADNIPDPEGILMTAATGKGLVVQHFYDDSGTSEYTRSYTGDGSWTSWEMSLSVQIYEAITVGGTLKSGTNLNNLKPIIGHYWVPNSGITNVPVSGKFGYLEAMQFATGTGIHLQRFTVYGNDTAAGRGDTYIRFFVNNQWYSWNKIAELTS